MADPISVISFAADIIALCYRYGCAVAGAPDEARDLAAEITSLSGVLVSIQGLVNQQDGQNGSSALPEILFGCYQTLEMISDRLKKYSPDTTRSRTDRVFNRLLWPLKRTETLELLAAVEKRKSTLTIAMETFTASMVVDQGHSITEIANRVESLNSRSERAEATARHLQVLSWLSSYDHEAQHGRAARMLYKDTCRWILEDERFNSWLEKSSSSYLWFTGQAGSGKTVLASFVVKYMQTLQKPNNGPAVYFYYDASTASSLNLDALLGSVLKQLCLSRSKLGLPQFVEEAFISSTGPTGTQKPPNNQQLTEMLHAILTELQVVTLIVDGLDEADQSGVICDFLTSLMVFKGYSIHIFTTSRPETCIREDPLQHYSQISAPESSTYHDIELYISERINAERRLRGLNRPLQDHIRDTLLSKSHGMFRWVQCQLDEICRLRTEKAIKGALESLPKNLEASYQRALGHIDEYDVPVARRTLLWLAHARRALRVNEIIEAVVVEVAADSIDQDARLNDPLDIVEICGTLVTYSALSQEIRLGHHSVREFLTKNQHKEHSFYFSYRRSHRKLAELCLSYLTMKDFSEGPLGAHAFKEVFSKYPLLLYSANSWVTHVLKSGAEMDLQPLIKKLLTASASPKFLFWIQVVLSQSQHGYRRPSAEGPGSPQPLYYAASYGLYETVKSLMAAGADINARGGRFGGTAYHAACWRRHPEIVRLLLEAGIDTTIEDYNRMTAFDLIEYSGFKDVAMVAFEYDKSLSVDDRTEKSLKALYQQPIAQERRTQTRSTAPSKWGDRIDYREAHKGFTFELETTSVDNKTEPQEVQQP